MAKRFGCEVHDYKSYRSDLGVQCFDFYIMYNGERYNFDYGYHVGGCDNYLLDTFSEFLGAIDVNPNSYKAQ